MNILEHGIKIVESAYRGQQGESTARGGTESSVYREMTDSERSRSSVRQ